MNTDASTVQDKNIRQIQECLLLSRIASFEDWSNIFRTRSFTLCKNDRDFSERFDSATVPESISSSMLNLSSTGLSVLQCSILSSLMSLRPSQVSPFLSVRKRTELTPNFPHKSDKLVSGPLVLLAPEWTVVKIALFRWSHRRVPRHTSTRAPYLCRRIPPGISFQKSLSSGSRQRRWAHNLCEGVPLGEVHMEEGVQVRVQVECGREEQGEGETHGEIQNEEATGNGRSNAHHGWHEDGMTRAYRHLSHAVWYAWNELCKLHENNDVWSVSVYTPRRLQWIAIDCRRNQL